MDAASSPATVRLAGLKNWMTTLLVKQGLFAAEAEIAALRMIESELMGRPAGGVRWLPRLLAAMEVGDIDPRAKIVTLTDLPALLVIDGGTGVAQVVLTHALQLAARKAAAAGAAMIVLKNSRPIGDPTACLAAATSLGCVAGIMTTCRRQTDPWQTGPSTVWAWPGSDGPLVTTATVPDQSNCLADALAAGLGGTKPSLAKKRLFADDAEAVCFLSNVSQITDLDRFHQVTGQALESECLAPPAWIFNATQWPESALIPVDATTELRELAKSSKAAAEW